MSGLVVRDAFTLYNSTNKNGFSAWMNFLNVNSASTSLSDYGVLGLAPNPSATEPYKSLPSKLRESGIISSQIFSLQLSDATDSSILTLGGYDEAFLRYLLSYQLPASIYANLTSDDLD